MLRLRKYFFFYLVLVCGSVKVFSQQNEEFRQAKEYYDYQRFMITSEFQKKLVAAKDWEEKRALRFDMAEFLSKLDSVRNVGYLGALIKVKNREILSPLPDSTQPVAATKSNVTGNQSAQYPGGIGLLREQLADLFYFPATVSDTPLQTQISFVVEKDGTMTNVTAAGDHMIFNRQAEIAAYLLPHRFIPAVENGQYVRSHFTVPLRFNTIL